MPISLQSTMPNIQSYTATKIFNGTDWLFNKTIVVADGIIKDITDTNEKPEAELIVPAFVDLQVYGAGGRLLSVFPDTTTLQVMHEHHIQNGTAFFMPTVATNTTQVMHNCIEAIRNYWHQGGQGVIGLHLEGPWLNPEKRGAHIENLIYSPSLQQVQQLLEYGKGIIKMITIAPEVCGSEVVDYLLAQDIVVSAGHSNASYQQAMGAFNKGIPAITHLYNAMSGLQHRNTGMVGAAFLHSSVKASIIPDGIHVSFEALRIANQLMGNRLFAITDAVTETNEGPYTHQLAENKYESNGVLSGSSLSMHQCLLNLIHAAQILDTDALCMCSIRPAKLVNIDMGIQINNKARFLQMDQFFNLKKVIIS